MHKKSYKTAGVSLKEAKKAMILIHGRGANADDILFISNYLKLKEFCLIAPEATNNTWYPNSFMAPPKENEPWLSSALQIINEIVAQIELNKINKENIYFLGFSQGACLTLEYLARNADVYGGAAAFTGGLIGDKIYRENYSGDFQSTRIFIGSSDPDLHVPVSRVEESKMILQNMNAEVEMKIYKNTGHTINEDEIETVNRFILHS